MSTLLLRTSTAFSPQTTAASRRISTRLYSLIIDGQEIRSVMAPMVAASDLPFRKLVRSYANKDEPILCYTQMLHSKKLVNDKTFRRNHIDFGNWNDGMLPPQRTCIEGMDDIEPYVGPHVEGGPLMVQLAGHDPSMVVDAAQIVLDLAAPNTVSGIDLNLGCPQGIAKKGKYGAFFMEQDEDLVCEILKQLRLSLPSHIKVSAKIRLPLEGDVVLKQRITKLVDSGIDFLTIHGRTLKENKSTVGVCHFDKIRLAIETARAIQPDFPVIANGGVQDYENIESILQQTGACAIMSSEALLETPNVFTVPTIQNDPRAALNQQLQFARDYIYLCAKHPPLPGAFSPDGGSFNVARGHLFKFLHRYLQTHPDLRNHLADTMPWNLKSALLLIDDLESRYASDADLEQFCGPTWYRRHRKSRNLIHHRGPTDAVPVLTVTERKRQMQERIQRLQEQKMEKEQRLAA